jgi:hypothetical protein
MRWNLSMALLLVFFFVSVFSGVSSAYSEEMGIITKADLRLLWEENKAFREELPIIKKQLAESKTETKKLKNEVVVLKIESSLREAWLIEYKRKIISDYWKGFLSGGLSGIGLGAYLSIQF